MLCEALCATVGLVVVLLALGWCSSGYFRKRGVKSPPSFVPFIGHTVSYMLSRKSITEIVQTLYHVYPEERYIGIWQFTKPYYVVRDLELLKQITIKDFDHFLDHLSLNVGYDVDVLFENGLFGLQGQKWRDMRATLSPAFTSSKMRGMFQFVVDCGKQMTEYYVEQMQVPENKVRGLVEMEMKDAFTRYANDVIATCAFGLSVNSFKEQNNQFFLMGKDATDFSLKRIINILVIITVPKICKFLGVTFFSKKLSKFYRNLVWDTAKYREDNKIVRHDMIHILMEVKKGTLKHDSHDDGKEAGFATVEESSVGKTNVKRVWTDDEIVAQAVLFFNAGFDTASTLLSFLTYELAVNPEIQRRLQAEIDEMTANLDGKLTYDCLQKMKYMDMVVCETLRMWPPFAVMDRQCTKPYTLPASSKNGKEVQLKVGELIWLPIYGLHRDPKYFKDPDVFDPERFSEENRNNIKPMTYIPFGSGPRNCIGSRFALMEAKAVLFHLLSEFDIVTTAKTQNPIKIKPSSIIMQPEKSIWLGFKPRTNI